jgi:hypothetical protein
MIPDLTQALANAAIGMKRIHFTPGDENSYQKSYVEGEELIINDDRNRAHNGFRMNIRTLVFTELAKVRNETKLFRPTFEPATRATGIRPIAIQINDSSVMNDHWEASLIYRCALNLERRYLMDTVLYYMSRRIKTANSELRIEWEAHNHNCRITEYPILTEENPSVEAIRAARTGKLKHTFKNVNREFFETIGSKIERLQTWL